MHEHNARKNMALTNPETMFDDVNNMTPLALATTIENSTLLTKAHHAYIFNKTLGSHNKAYFIRAKKAKE